MAEERIKIDFADGERAIDRTMRSIVMIADGAIGRLLDLGWTRKKVNLQINDEEPLPCYVTLKGERVFKISPIVSDGQLEIQGEWLVEPHAPGIIDKFWGC